MRDLINLIESFNSAASYQWYDRSNDDMKLLQAEFQIGDGWFVVQFRMDYHSPGVWTLSFTRNQSLDLSNRGNAMLVLSTVMQITREFISTVEPRWITFSAAMDEPSRVKLYPKLMQIMMREFPQFTDDPPKVHGLERKFTSYQVQQPPKPYVAPPAPEPDPTLDYSPMSDQEWEDLIQYMDELDQKDRVRRAS